VAAEAAPGNPLLCREREEAELCRVAPRAEAELCRDLLKGMGVLWGEIKGVEDSEAEPKVAALEISLPLPLGCCCLPGAGPVVLPGRRWSGRPEPELCLDLSMCTGVERGEMKGEAGGDCGWLCRGEMGWKEKCLRLEPGLATGATLGWEVAELMAVGSLTIRGLKDTLRLLERLGTLVVGWIGEFSMGGKSLVSGPDTSMEATSFTPALLKAPTAPESVGDFKFFSRSCLS